MMFLCESCRGSCQCCAILRSRGPCESCKRVTSCVDCHCYLRPYQVEAVARIRSLGRTSSPVETDLGKTGALRLVPCVQHVTDYPDHRQARAAMPGILGQEGCITARCAGGEYERHLPGGSTETATWGRVTAFHIAEDAPRDDEGALAAWCARRDDLPDGSRRVLAPIGHLREIARMTEAELAGDQDRDTSETERGERP